MKRTLKINKVTMTVYMDGEVKIVTRDFIGDEKKFLKAIEKDGRMKVLEVKDREEEELPVEIPVAEVAGKAYNNVQTFPGCVMLGARRENHE